MKRKKGKADSGMAPKSKTQHKEQFSHVLKLAGFLSPIAFSIVGIGFSWQANQLAQSTYNKQFVTDFKVSCQQRFPNDTYTLTDRLWVNVPVICTLYNDSNRTITINSVWGTYATQPSGAVLVPLYAANIKSSSEGDAEVSGTYGDLNIKIPQGEQVAVSFDAQLITKPDYRAYFDCGVPYVAAYEKGNLECKLKEPANDSWEKIAWSDTVPEDKRGEAQAEFTFISADSEIRKAAFDL